MEQKENKKAQRQKRIQAILIDRGMADIRELCDLLSCSEATARNDLRELESQGLIKRTFGGAMSTGNLVGSNLEHQKLQRGEKDAVAHYVVKHLLHDGQTIVLDVGTTTLALAQAIAQSSLTLNVVTNSLSTANALVRNENISIHLPGGEYDRFLDSFDWADTLSYYQNIHAHYFFMSCNGFTAETGFTVPKKRLAVTKSIIADQVNKSVMLMDHTKIGKIAFYKACDLEMVDILIVDDRCTEREQKILEDSKIDVRYAPFENI